MSNIQNYRPISILNNFAKVFEQVICSTIYNGVRSNISEYQHGFLPGRSTLTNLATVSQYIAESLDGRTQVDVIYIDLSHAFDSVNHHLLCHKLSGFGASPGLVKLLHSYLVNRICHVFYNGHSSREFVATSGVPQGSNLGPLLFVLFINDLLSSVSCPILAYADDIKLYSRIDSGEDAVILQNNIDRLISWCGGNGLKINSQKCCIVTYNRTLDPFIYQYSIDNCLITRSTTTKDLGVTFSHNFSFGDHMTDLCRSASRSLGFVMRAAKEFRDLDLIKSLYFAFVLSKLEYASLIWYPHYACHHIPLDRIHRRFLKFLSFLLDGVYPERGTDQETLLVRHGFSPLAERRRFHAARFLWKLVKNGIDSPYLLSRIPIHVPRAGSRHIGTFYLSTPRTNVLRQSPINVMCSAAELQFDDIFR